MTSPSPLNASCHCGAVQITIAERPDYLNECNCTLCNSHGVWWGYFAPDQVEVTGETRGYARVDKPDPVVAIHFCPTCGCTTHFRTMEGFAERTGITDVMGVNMRLFAKGALAGVELRFPDGAAWDGVGQWGFVRQAVML